MQAANPPPSRLQPKVLLAFVDVKLNVAVVLLVNTGGLAVMFVSGSVVSTPAPIVMLLSAGV